MPSSNRREWLGVSTSQDQSTIHFLTENLRILERSTRDIHQNLSNIRANSSSSNNVHLSLEEQTIIDVDPTSQRGINETLEEEVEKVIIINDDLKHRVQKVIQENANFKEHIKRYKSQHEAWKEAFIKDTQKIYTELNTVIDHSKELKNEYQNQCKLKKKTSFLSACNRTKSWYTMAGAFGRNACSSIKRKFLAFLEIENNAEQIYYYGLI